MGRRATSVARSGRQHAPRLALPLPPQGPLARATGERRPEKGRLSARRPGVRGRERAVRLRRGAPAHQPKIKFLTLMRNESLARLRTRLDDATGELVIEEGGHERARDDLATREGRLAVEAFFRRFMPWELRGPPEVLAARDRFRFTDSRKGYVSLINLASVSAIEGWVGAPVNPLRFRGNLHVEGLEPFGQFDLPGQVLRSGTGVRLKVTK